MRTVVLSAIKGGITRLRTKGGANPESLYDGVNCYITAARTVKPRPGSEMVVALPPGTIGLSLFNGVFQVFASEIVGQMPEGYNLNILGHPENPEGGHTLRQIWKAEPFMGVMYVVAEWSDGSVYHYYLRTAQKWKPNHAYKLGDLVEPTTPNGMAYEVTRLNPPAPTWKPNVERALGDVVEPTADNGFSYTVVDTVGDAPKSGSVEPVWPTEDGAIVHEDSGSTPPQQPGPPPPPPPGSGGGYGNPGGGKPPGGGNPTNPDYQTVIQ